MSTLFKDLYNRGYLEQLSLEIKKNYSAFDDKAYILEVLDDTYEEKELKQRMRHISTTLGLFLEGSFSDSIKILKKTFINMDTDLTLQNMIFQDFVEVYGLEEVDISLEALAVFTVGSSSEFAIRRFIIKDTKTTMNRMLLWAQSDNEHLRRLASEGCRPRLPWAIALEEYKNDPSDVLEVLDLLKDDESVYVRKSVANNINDISKDNPKIVIELTKKWIGFSKNRDKLLKHGCRTLLKAMDSEVLGLFGLEKATHIRIKDVCIQDDVKLGEELEFSFVIESEKSIGALRIEYQMGFLRKNGSHSKKMFKISESNFDMKIKKVIKKHSFRPISTRVYYEGMQKVNIVLNGEIVKELVFNLS